MDFDAFEGLQRAITHNLFACLINFVLYVLTYLDLIENGLFLFLRIAVESWTLSFYLGKAKEILKIKQKDFVLLLIKFGYFFGTPGINSMTGHLVQSSDISCKQSKKDKITHSKM